MHALRQDVKRKWGGVGLHIAQIVEIGLARVFLTHVTGMKLSPQQATRLFSFFLNDSEKWAIFVMEDSSVSRVSRDARTRLAVEPERILALFSMGSRAKGKLTDIMAGLRREGIYEDVVDERGPATFVLVSRRPVSI